MNYVFKTLFICVVQGSQSIHENSKYRIIVFFLFEFFGRFNTHLLTVDLFQYMSKEKEVQVTYDVNVITFINTANVRFLHDYHKIQVRFLRSSHVASDSPSPNKIERGIYDWHVKRHFVLCCTLNHLNTIFHATISHGSNDWQNSQHTHVHQTHTASCD